ncbi:MAG: SAM-dependent methyltransferase [Pseudomonadota bacterium]
MTPLAARLRRQIAQTGPMPVAAFMAACLTDPEHGYYTTRDPLGPGGDFVTAPEISQMFGELIGLWAASVWRMMGAPDRFVLAELGPGRGTLMADALRAGARVPGFAAAAQVWLVEASPVLRAAQARAVPNADWAAGVADLPPGPAIVLANEFFDALPIRQFLRAGAGWRERVVGLTGDALALGLAPAAADPVLEARFGDVAEGEIVEVGAAGEAVAAVLAARGAVLLALDYGAWQGTGDTLQAVRDHAFAEVLADAGAADLTAHVGFRWLAEAAADQAAQFDTQGAFLERLGITPRAQALARAGDTGAAAAHRRLVHPQEMGTLFKVLALRPPALPPLPGFAP